MFSRGGDGDPGSVKKAGSEAIERLWHIVKRVSDAATLAEKLKELAPLLGSAASWVLRIVIGSGLGAALNPELVRRYGRHWTP